MLDKKKADCHRKFNLFFSNGEIKRELGNEFLSLSKRLEQIFLILNQTKMQELIMTIKA